MTRHIRFSLDRGVPGNVADGDPNVRYGLLEGDSVVETAAFDSRPAGPVHRLAGVRLLPPCWPSKIVCVGRNYVDHAKELGNPVPEEPLIFLKPPSALIADGDPIVYPALSQFVSFEGELALVVGRRARRVRREEASAILFGYTCLNDITARDLQKKDNQWARAKGFDTFCPAGPWIVPRAELDLAGVRVRSFVDGAKKQDAPVAGMIFPIDVIIAFVSEFLTLEPGDLIATGTPPGVGPLQPGSQVRVEVDGIGALENKVIREG
jgi:2-keto-4-pentenoate hydratase/2-oxohepta-3-ene-1,7-dioic acid hydratase in catechol pathway